MDLFDISKVNLDGDFNSQVQNILQHVRLTRQEVEELDWLINDLQQTIEYKWHGCKVEAFGSIVTGLGIKGSDIDCFVYLPQWLNPPQVNFVQQARNLLRQRKEIFQNVFAIIGAKVPIVKFYHVPTDRCCDVSFKSPAAVENSKLLSHFMQMDPRVLPLTILIKYWSKVHSLTGTNLMPNYCLTLLVIFYLQQKTVLPSVRILQNYAEDKIIDEWNVGINSVLHVTNNRDSLYELINGFFKYYSTFNYKKYVISIYLGQVVEKDLFYDVDSVPEEFILYKNNVGNKICKPLRLDVFMCVQDPFEHNRNCAVAVHPKLAQNIMLHIKSAANSFSGDIDNVLKKLLTSSNSTSVNVKRSRPKHPPISRAPRGIVKRYKQNHIQKQNKKTIVNKMTNDMLRDWL